MKVIRSVAQCVLIIIVTQVHGLTQATTPDFDHPRTAIIHHIGCPSVTL